MIPKNIYRDLLPIFELELSDKYPITGSAITSTNLIIIKANAK